MSLDVLRDLRQHLYGDVGITNFLPSYEGQESIFITVPENCGNAYVHLREPHTTVDASAKNGDKYSLEHFLDVAVASTREWSEYDTGTIDIIAKAVRRRLHRANITPYSSITIELIEALGPIQADAEGWFGRIVPVRLIARETS